jgi:hypothetical protein
MPEDSCAFIVGQNNADEISKMRAKTFLNVGYGARVKAMIYLLISGACF